MKEETEERDTEKAQWGEWVREKSELMNVPLCVSFLSEWKKALFQAGEWITVHPLGQKPKGPYSLFLFHFWDSGTASPWDWESSGWRSQPPAAFRWVPRELGRIALLGFHRSLWEGRGINNGGEGKDRQGELILQWECRCNMSKERKQCSKVMSFPKVHMPPLATVCPQVIWCFELQSPHL